MELKAALKKLRAELRLSQAGLARLLNLSLTGYANYESGERQPRADTLSELSRIAEGKELSKLKAVFDGAFEKEVEHIKGPVTPEETAWSDALVQLIRVGVLSASIKQEIIDTLEGGKGRGYKAIDETLIALKVLRAESAEQKLEVLVKAFIDRTGSSPAQAYTSILNEHPALAARIEFEGRAKAGKAPKK